MTGFILNGLSESLLSSRLFRIKAWVLQVPFLSMIFLYFFDYSNLNHSIVFYLFLYYNNFSVSLCRYVAFFRETLETLETLCSLFALSVRTFILVPFLLYLVLFTLTLLFALFTCGRYVFLSVVFFFFCFLHLCPIKIQNQLSKINYQLSTIVCYGDISSATICFFGLCLCVLCTRRVVLIDSKSCLEACLQADFSINL